MYSIEIANIYFVYVMRMSGNFTREQTSLKWKSYMQLLPCTMLIHIHKYPISIRCVSLEGIGTSKFSTFFHLVEIFETFQAPDESHSKSTRSSQKIFHVVAPSQLNAVPHVRKCR